MSDLKKLEINRLIREFEYLESDYEYKSELIREADSSFLKSIDKILDRNSELRSIYNEKVNTKTETTIEENQVFDSNIEEYEESDIKQDIKSDKIKKLYREIVKITHPDRVDNKNLNNLYIEASRFYDTNDIIGIYKICEHLFIGYGIDPSDIQLIKKNIQSLKERISFIENTRVWGWYNISEEKTKDMAVLDFIRSKIIDQR